MSTAASTTQLVISAYASPGRRSRERTPPLSSRSPASGRGLRASSADSTTSSTARPQDHRKMVPVSGMARSPPNTEISTGPAAWPSEAANV